MRTADPQSPRRWHAPIDLLLVYTGFEREVFSWQVVPAWFDNQGFVIARLGGSAMWLHRNGRLCAT